MLDAQREKNVRNQGEAKGGNYRIKFFGLLAAVDVRSQRKKDVSQCRVKSHSKDLGC